MVCTVNEKFFDNGMVMTTFKESLVEFTYVGEEVMVFCILMIVGLEESVDQAFEDAWCMG